MRRGYTTDAEGNLKECSLLEWAEWMERAIEAQPDRHIVQKTTIGDHEVSTVFLGLDHNWGSGPPLLWETMVFPECDECDRYSTLAEARAGHQAMCRKVLREET